MMVEVDASFQNARQHCGGRFCLALSFSGSPKTLDSLQPAAAFLLQLPASEPRAIKSRAAR